MTGAHVGIGLALRDEVNVDKGVKSLLWLPDGRIEA